LTIKNYVYVGSVCDKCTPIKHCRALKIGLRHQYSGILVLYIVGFKQ